MIRSLTLLFLLTSCIDRIDLESSNPNQRVFIVEGSISNLQGPYEVSVSVSTTQLSNQNDFVPPPPVIDAQISIIRQSDNFEEPLIHINTIPGTYRTHENSTFQGEISETYFLRVEVDGKMYESTPEQILDPVEIDSIRVQFNESTHLVEIVAELSDPAETNFYQWAWNGFRTVHSFLPGGVGSFQDLTCDPFLFKDCCALCYLPVSGNKIRVIDDRFVNNQDLAIIIAEIDIPVASEYLLEVQQFTLSRDYHEYLSLLVLQQQSTGRLFDPPFFRIIGNIRSVDGNETTLGYFSAAGAHERIHQFSADEFSNTFRTFEICDDCRELHPLADTVKPENWM